MSNVIDLHGNNVEIKAKEIRTLMNDQQYLTDAEIKEIKRLRNSAIENNRRTSKYKPADTVEMTQIVGNCLAAKGHEFTTKLITTTGKKGTKHVVEFTITSELIAGGEGNPQIFLVNSFNGECPVQIRGGMYRLICTNGLVSQKQEEFARIIHKRGETYEEKVRNLEYQIVATLEWLRNDYNDLVGAMKMDKLAYTEKMRIVVGLKQVPDQIKGILAGTLHPDNQEKLREADRGNSMWATYNIVNEVMREYGRTKVDPETGVTAGISEFDKNEDLMEDMTNLRLRRA